MGTRAAQIFVQDYVMRLLGADEPKITINLGKREAGQERLIQELLSGTFEVQLHISTDPMMAPDTKLSVCLMISTQHFSGRLKRFLGRIKSASATDFSALVLPITYRYHPDTAECFYKQSRAWIDAGKKLSIGIFNSQNVLLGECETQDLGRFSWSERMGALQQLHNQRNFN